MVTKKQIEVLKAAWEQARRTTLHAQAAWALAIQAHHALIRSFQAVGYPYIRAKAEVDGLMKEHSKHLLAAKEHMDNLAAEYKKATCEYKKQRGKS